MKDITLFQGINREFIDMIIDNSRRIEITEGEFVIHEGEKSNDEAYIIQEGFAGVYMGGNFIKKLGEGKIFGEMALITTEERIASIKAETNLVLLKINKDLLFSIIKKFENGKEIQETIMKRIKENLEKGYY